MAIDKFSCHRWPCSVTTIDDDINTRWQLFCPEEVWVVDIITDVTGSYDFFHTFDQIFITIRSIESLHYVCI